MAKQQRRGAGPLIGVVVVGVVAVAAVIAISVVGGDDVAESDLPVTADVVVEGEELPRLDDPAADPAVGMAAPRVEGTDFDSGAVNAPVEGEPTVVLFLAHWCPVCQDEVEEVQAWIDEGGQPDDVALVAVSTGVDASQPNFPPGDWLDAEGWAVPTIVDDEASAAQTAYGLAAYPFWVFVTADGTVAGRHAGGLPVEGLEQIMQQLREVS